MTKKKSGSIINISSSAAHEANIGRSAYASSKSSIEEYNSNNTNLLSVEEMKTLLKDLPEVRTDINN